MDDLRRATRRAERNTASFQPGQVLRIYGMRRSGNHALIDWIFRNAPQGSGLFLNACRPGRDPVRSARSVGVYERGTEQPVKGLEEKLAAAGDAPFTVVSYEDAVPPEILQPLYDAPERVAVIYRSFLNWSASLLRKIQGNPGYGPVERSRIMMTALTRYRAILDRVQGGDVLPLLYDDWMATEGYRAQVLHRLGLPGDDLDRGEVQRFGGGSSFQGQEADVQALATDRRAAQMSGDLEYQLMLWTAARDPGFMERLAEAFPADSERLSGLLETAQAKVQLP